MEKKVLETEEFVVASTGHDYDFARYVVNKTNHPLYFTFNDEKSDWDYDEDGELEYAHFVFSPVTAEEFADADNNENFIVEPNDWVGLFNTQFVEL